MRRDVVRAVILLVILAVAAVGCSKNINSRAFIQVFESVSADEQGLTYITLKLPYRTCEIYIPEKGITIAGEYEIRKDTLKTKPGLIYGKNQNGVFSNTTDSAGSFARIERTFVIKGDKLTDVTDYKTVHLGTGTGVYNPPRQYRRTEKPGSVRNFQAQN